MREIAGLVLVRGVSRRGEVAIRLALGATRTRIIRLLLVENLVLALPGAICGLARVWIALPLLSERETAACPCACSSTCRSIDRRRLLEVAACVSALVFGFMPAFRGSRIDLVAVMNEDRRRAGRREAGSVPRWCVAGGGVGVLLVGAGLVARSLEAASRQTPASMPTTRSRSRSTSARTATTKPAGCVFFKRLLDGSRADAGVESATLAMISPLTMVDRIVSPCRSRATSRAEMKT